MAIDGANATQVGGDHYKRTGGEEHWDRIWRLYGRGYFVACITKYAERYQLKNGLEDLRKVAHFTQKLIELETAAAGDYSVQEEWNRGNMSLAAKPSLAEYNKAEAIVGLKVWEPGSGFVKPEPAPINFKDLVNPTGWIGFTFEGAEGKLGEGQHKFRCTRCRTHFAVSEEVAPAHVHSCTIDATEAGPNYVNQG